MINWSIVFSVAMGIVLADLYKAAGTFIYYFIKRRHEEKENRDLLSTIKKNSVNALSFHFYKEESNAGQ